ncbi:MAG TPA: ParB/RepB/Spo0J family partition protein [Spirochaetota bacterium]|nr:ParB/RepB/Spo0J family partition protein [Spirochaetota bacterium]HOM38889.1 ParB/RepB/Spo0J family partition protein [Spirochaetota bacterium]HPQ49132.1 ParB/RepB/Spo0J family partition protein [Spirochaetota bacterium]
MNKKKTLGKGLAALINDLPDEFISESDISDIQDIPISKIKENPYQPRKSFNEEKIRELAESIKENGIIQPLVVRPKDSYYQIVVGERRFRAAKLANLMTVPCLIKDVNDEKMAEIALIENLQREDLNPLEVAFSYNRLITDFGLTHEQLSQRVGKSRVAITNTLRLLKLPEKVQQDIINGIITEGHARVLLSLEEIDKILFARDIIVNKGLSVRETEELVKNIKDKDVLKKEDKKEYYKDPNILSIEENLTRIFGTKVVIKNNKKNKGKIEIEYYSKEEFERIKSILEGSNQRIWI